MAEADLPLDDAPVVCGPCSIGGPDHVCEQRDECPCVCNED